MAEVKPLWKRKRVRVLGIAALVVGAAIAVPFVFTTAIVRYVIAKTDYGAFKITIDSASLNPGGSLTINGLTVHDVDDQAGKPLIETRSLRMEFNWGDLNSRHFQSIYVDGLKVFARAGKDSPVTLLRLLQPQKFAGAATAPATATAGPGVRIDQIVLLGDVFLEGFEPWVKLLPPQTASGIPIRLHVRTTGTAERGVTDIALAVGERENAATELPTIAAQVHVETPAHRDPEVTIRSMVLKNVKTEATREVIAALWPGYAHLPLELQKGAEGRFDVLTISGQVTGGDDAHFTGDVALRGIRGKIRGNGLAAAIEDAVISASVDLPLKAESWREMTLKNGTITVGTAQYGGWKVANIRSDFEVREAEANLVQLSAEFADGSIIASGSWLMQGWALDHGVVTVRDVNSGKVFAHLPEELKARVPLTLDGPIGAKITLTGWTNDAVAGRIEIGTTEMLTLTPVKGRGMGPITLRGAGVSGQIEWAPGEGAYPVITKGRVWGASVSMGDVVLNNLVATAGMNAAGLLRVNDIAATLGADGDLTGSVHYAVAGGRIEKLAFVLGDIEPNLWAAWLPAGVKTDMPLSAALTVSPAADAAEYSANLQVTMPDISTIYFRDMPLVISGKPQVDVTLGVATDYSSIASANVMVTGFSSVTLSDELVSTLTQQDDALTTGGVKLDLGKLNINAAISAADRTISGTAKWSDFAAITKRTDGRELNLTNLGAKIPFVVPLAWETAINRGTIKDAVITLKDITYGANTIRDMDVKAGFDKGIATILPESTAGFADGTIKVGAVYAVAGNRLDSLTLTLSKLDQSLIVKNLLSEKFGAEGTVSGEIKIARNERDQLAGSIDVAADGPGRLKFSEEVTAVLAPVAKQAMVESKAPMPANLDQIVSAQLKNYPYTAGKITARDASGDLLVQLNYTRSPLVPGEPGYAVPVQYEGNSVVVNYPIQFKSTTLSIPKRNVMDILALASGLGELLPIHRKPAVSNSTTRPATTRPAATRPG